MTSADSDDAETTLSNIAVPLAKIDFWPQHDPSGCTRQPVFTTLLHQANDWLRQNPRCEIVSCETSRKKIEMGANLYDGECRFKAGGDDCCIWAHGLRMWVRSCNDAKQQTLAYIDITPVAGEKSLTNLVDKFNQHLEARPLDGEIVSINTVMISTCDSSMIDPLRMLYIDNYHHDRIMFLRIFYLRGPPTQDFIGMADFIPNLLKEGGILKAYPDFEPLSVPMEKARQWIAENKVIQVKNIQTVDAEYCRKDVCSIRLDPLWLRDTNVEKDIRCRICFIRVAYTIPRDPSRMQRDTFDVMQVPFIPTQFEQEGCCSESHYETMPLTMDRITNWLNSTGGRVLCAEIAIMQEYAFFTDECVHATEFKGEWFITRQKNRPIEYHRYPLVEVIKVYLEKPVDEPPMQTPQPCFCTIL